MWAYLVRRVMAGAIVLAVLSFAVFLLVALSGDPLAVLRANPDTPPATIHAMSANLHLNQPLPIRYWGWLVGMLHGDFGTSANGQPVGTMLGSAMLVTLRITLPAVVLSVLAGVLMGVVSAIRQYKPVDYLSTALAYLFFSTPVFVLGLLLKDFLAVDVNKAAGKVILFTVGPNSPGLSGTVLQSLVNDVQHEVLPVITLVLVTIATWSRYQRAAMLDVLNADYIKLARAKGLSPRRVLFVHALRNALIPMVTIVAIDFAALIAGALITEIVFAWNGMGMLLYNALTGTFGGLSPDVYTVQGWLMVTATLVIVFNILADLIYALIDPRIRYA